MKKASYIFLLFFFVGSFFLTSCQTDQNAKLAKEYFNLGNAYFDLKKYSDAARAYQYALSYQPDMKISVLNLARAYAEQGDVKSALDIIRPLYEKDPENTVLGKYLAYLLYKSGDVIGAYENYKEIAKKLPADGEIQYNCGVCAKELGKKDEAYQALQNYFNLDGTEPKAYILLGDLAADNHNWPQARDAYLKAVKNGGKTTALFLSLSLAHVNLEEYAQGSAALKSALTAAAEKDKPEISFRLAKVLLYALEDYSGAYKAFSEAWKGGYTDKKNWTDLMAVPDLPQKERLSADFKSAGIMDFDHLPEKPKESATKTADQDKQNAPTQDAKQQNPPN